MKLFFLDLPRNIIACFRGRMIFGHLIAIVLTAIFVLSGFDYAYFVHTRNPTLTAYAFTAAPVGGLLPIMLPLLLFLLGILLQRPKILTVGWAVGQAELMGSLLSSTYKAFTGRVHPPFEMAADFSHRWRFGWLRGGVFWGWPSSHTTIAFAMAITVYMLFPKHRWLGITAILYALYIGIGVSMTIHWFSDFVAGIIFGTIIGTVVGTCFRSELVKGQTAGA